MYLPLIRRVFSLLLLLATFAHAEEFLDPAVAFKPAVRALDGQTIEVAEDEHYRCSNCNKSYLE